VIHIHTTKPKRGTEDSFLLLDIYEDHCKLGLEEENRLGHSLKQHRKLLGSEITYE
jgi:hypothetical protein